MCDWPGMKYAYGIWSVLCLLALLAVGAVVVTVAPLPDEMGLAASLAA